MKKLLLLSLFTMIAMGMVYSQSITVTSPNGGQDWAIGSTQNITWTSSSVSGDVTLKLYRGGTDLGRIDASAVPYSPGTYSWTIAASLPNGTPVTPGSNYKVMVRSTATVNDLSNANFTISSPPGGATITVDSPNGGQNWQIGSTHNITWSSSSVSGDVTLKLYRGGTDLGRIDASTKPVSPGTYSWTIAATLPNGTPVTPGSNYHLAQWDPCNPWKQLQGHGEKFCNC